MRQKIHGITANEASIHIKLKINRTGRNNEWKFRQKSVVSIAKHQFFKVKNKGKNENVINFKNGFLLYEIKI